ncbi:MAG: rod shape-determining protein [Oscillospiraceae bacterium]|nr:rod shape-determining protein [Oscillospiraceae bacterium]
MGEAMREQDASIVFSLDIGTRSIIGVVGEVVDGKLHVLAIEKENHGQRSMLDGQIENIGQVAQVAKHVIERLQKRTKIRLARVCVAAAGRALKSEAAAFTLELPTVQPITDDDISHLEAGAVSESEQVIIEQSDDQNDQYYMVGYTVTGYRIDGYPMSSIKDHSGKVLEAEVVATFLPRGVVDSLYAVVSKVGLEVASLTLEPIAALNAAIPADIRLLNLVLVDIGAGTSDIAICRDGSVVGYTMATIAGDEITELLMRTLLVDFETGEHLKMSLNQDKPVTYTDILGLSHDVDAKQLQELVSPSVSTLAEEIAQRVLDLNGRLPSAVFLAGGGCKLTGLREKVAEALKMDPNRVTVAGNHFQRNSYAEEYNLNDPEYATPLGIAISAGLGLINDSYVILLNGEPAKLFRSGSLIIRDLLMMNGHNYNDMMGRTGENLTFTLNGERKFFRGGLPVPPVLLLNGELATLTDTVHAGDHLQFVPAKPGEDASKRISDVLGSDFKGSVTVNGAKARLDAVIHTGDDIWADRKEPVEELEPEPVPTPTPVVKPAKASPAPADTPSGDAGQIRITLNGEKLMLFGKPGGDPYYLMDLLKFSDLDFQNLDKPVELRVNGEPGQFQEIIKDGDSVEIV